MNLYGFLVMIGLAFVRDPWNQESLPLSNLLPLALGRDIEWLSTMSPPGWSESPKL
jgi:hypothetical protein